MIDATVTGFGEVNISVGADQVAVVELQRPPTAR